MKKRNGFVSNSSSASFIVKKEDLTELQVVQILNYKEWAERINKEMKFEFGIVDEYWTVTEEDEVIKGSTFMDNFDMLAFLKAIGVSEDKIYFDGENY